MWVGSCPVFRTFTASTRTASATARTSDPASASWECSELVRFRERKPDLPREISVKPTAVAVAAAAVIKAMSCGGTLGEDKGTDFMAATGLADISVESGLSFPAVLTAVTMK